MGIICVYNVVYKGFDMGIPQLTKEEEFVYYVSVGNKTKSDAYRLIQDCTGLSNETIATYAWRYSNRPEVMHMMSNEQDNLYVKYHRARHSALDTLLDLTLNATSEKVQSDSAIGLLNQTAKLNKTMEFTIVNNEMNVMLEDLRSVLLSPPIDSLGGIKTPNDVACQNMKTFDNETPNQIAMSNSETFQNEDSDNNSIPNSENFCYEHPKDVSSSSTLEVEPIYNVRQGLYLGDKILTQDMLDEQKVGINPLGNRKGDSHSRIQDYSTGRFVDYSTAQDWLNEHPNDVSLKTDENTASLTDQEDE